MELTQLFIRERKYLQNVSPATVTWYEQSFRAFADAWGSKADLTARIQQMLDAGTNPTSVNTYLRCIRAFLNWARREGHVDTSFPVPKLKCEEKLIEALSRAQIDRIVRAKLTTMGDKRLHCLSLLLLDCGLRIEEALGLRTEDVDFDNLLVRVKGKGGKQRLVPISMEMRKALFRWMSKREAPGLVFGTRTGARLNQRNLLRDFKTLGGKLGVLDGVRFSFHTLRHTFAVNYVRNGGDAFRLQRILGHSTLDMTRRYVNLQTEDLQAVHDRLSVLVRR